MDISCNPDMDMTKRFLQHYLNPLHIYCRLRTFGVAKTSAKRFCGAYERVYRTLSV